MSTPPLAFLDDPFRSYSSTLLFLGTTGLAAALVSRLMGHHWRRDKRYSGECPLCEQSRKELMIAGKDLVKDVESEGLGSEETRREWPHAATPSSNGYAGERLGSGGRSGHCEDLEVV
jgi:hypothetical protein